MKEKKIIWWFIFIGLCLWQLPQLLVALLIIPFMGKLTLIRDKHYNFCFVGENMSGGISLGPISFVSKYLSTKPEKIAHEFEGHTKQSLYLGWLYLPIIGIPSFIWAMSYNDRKNCYYDFYTEKLANYYANLEVNEFCNLCFKTENLR